MRKRLTILMMILAVGILSATAQKSEPTTANYRQAVELLDSSDYEGAAALLQEELKLRPKDGYVWNKMSMVYVSQYDLDSAKICMDNAIKYLPKKETEKLGELYSLRAVVNYLTDDIDGALADATSYQKMKPDVAI